MNLNDDEDDDEDDIDDSDYDDDEDYYEVDKIEHGDLLEIDRFKRRYDRIIKSYLMKDPSMTKEQFISFVETQISQTKENPLFPTKQILVCIIKNVKYLTEEEFQQLRASIINKK